MFRNYQARAQQVEPNQSGIVRYSALTGHGLITSDSGYQFEYASAECAPDVKLGDRVTFRVALPQTRHGFGLAVRIKKVLHVN